jgi:hypothetical protein
MALDENGGDKALVHPPLHSTGAVPSHMPIYIPERGLNPLYKLGLIIILMIHFV